MWNFEQNRPRHSDESRNLVALSVGFIRIGDRLLSRDTRVSFFCLAKRKKPKKRLPPTACFLRCLALMGIKRKLALLKQPLAEIPH